MTLFKNRNSSPETYKAVFSVTIDTNSEYREKSDYHESLVPGGKYWFKQQEKHATYDDLKEFAIRVLNNELDDECRQFLDIPVIEIKVKGVYEGSIELFFIVVFGVIAGVTGIKDLHDSIDFLRTLVEKKLEKRFQQKYGNHFRIDVRKQIPRDRDYYDKQHFHKNHFPLMQSNKQSKRDGFFYYLLFSNIVLLAIVIVLVANAVVKVYF